MAPRKWNRFRFLHASLWKQSFFFFAVTAFFSCFPFSGCWSSLTKPFPLFVFPGWFSGQHRWPCPGVLWVLQHLLQWRQWPHGGATPKTSLPRARHGKWNSLSRSVTLYFLLIMFQHKNFLSEFISTILTNDVVRNNADGKDKNVC